MYVYQLITFCIVIMIVHTLYLKLVQMWYNAILNNVGNLSLSEVQNISKSPMVVSSEMF